MFLAPVLGWHHAGQPGVLSGWGGKSSLEWGGVGWFELVTEAPGRREPPGACPSCAPEPAPQRLGAPACEGQAGPRRASSPADRAGHPPCPSGRVTPPVPNPTAPRRPPRGCPRHTASPAAPDLFDAGPKAGGARSGRRALVPAPGPPQAAGPVMAPVPPRSRRGRPGGRCRGRRQGLLRCAGQRRRLGSGAPCRAVPPP